MFGKMRVVARLDGKEIFEEKMEGSTAGLNLAVIEASKQQAIFEGRLNVLIANSAVWTLESD